MATSCVAVRGIRHGNASIYDYSVFPQDTVHNTPAAAFRFAGMSASERVFDTLMTDIYIAKTDSMVPMTLNEAVDCAGKSSAAIIIRNDTILYEHYTGRLDSLGQSCIFSVTKTITGIMCGIALREGYIKSVEDPVTDYMPELERYNPMFSKLRIEHLLDMTAGLKFNENYNWNPFSGMARLYMGNNAMKQIRKVKFSHEPGTHYAYNSMTTAILGAVIERATGVPYAQYLSEKLWKPLGMEQPALIGLDYKKPGMAKSYAGLTTNIRDLAKIGRLYLNCGNWGGVQIVDSSFVKRSLSKHVAGENSGTYSYNWYWGTSDYKQFSDKADVYEYYSDAEDVEVCGTRRDRKSGTYEAILHRGGFWAYGLYGQVLYINIEKNYIGVYLGEDRKEEFYNVFDRLYDYL